MCLLGWRCYFNFGKWRLWKMYLLSPFNGSALTPFGSLVRIIDLTQWSAIRGLLQPARIQQLNRRRQALLETPSTFPPTPPATIIPSPRTRMEQRNCSASIHFFSWKGKLLRWLQGKAEGCSVHSKTAAGEVGLQVSHKGRNARKGLSGDRKQLVGNEHQ